MYVRAKKSLGQHFLKDENIAKKIVDSLLPLSEKVLEIGPGTGVLTKYLIENKTIKLTVAEIDRESIAYLIAHYPHLTPNILQGDFLNMDIHDMGNLSIIGNLPYNISSQIFFKVLENRNQIPQVVCMIQKEVAERIASKEGNKTYGILSVFLQAFYSIEYLFTVHENVFIPPPKVKSGVIRLIRNDRQTLGCDEVLFFKVVKTSFNQRRKAIRNSLKPIIGDKKIDHPLVDKRPEQLTVDEFVVLTMMVEKVLQF